MRRASFVREFPTSERHDMDVRIALLAGSLGLALSACTTSGNPHYANGPYYGSGAAGVCVDCGVVQRISSYTGERRSTTGGGAVVGAVVGGALGNQVGSGDGKKAATVAGAVVGGIVGNNIEKNRAGGTWYELQVQMADGRNVTVTQDDLNGIREGARVRLRDGRAYLD
jgi:outer membrane lipoprotein SlyB